MTSQLIQNELRRADKLRQEFERLVYSRGGCQADERGWHLLAQWSIAIEHHVSTVGLIVQGQYGSALALLRPIVEAVVRGHYGLFCSDEVLAKIRSDDYRVKFGTVGKEIDEYFGLQTLMQDFLEDSAKILHSFTHSGLAQVQRRFKDGNLQPNYKDAELVQLINTATSGLFMLTNDVTKHFGYEDEWKLATQLYVEWSSPVEQSPVT